MDAVLKLLSVMTGDNVYENILYHNNGKNLFQNGASYELVRMSIKELSDEELKAIYKEVTGKEIEE